MADACLILETSGRTGAVAIARGQEIVRTVTLDASRRHARDLASTVQSLLTQEGLKPTELAGVMVSVGPGSYTGLRVGVMSAKSLAYATGCALIAVPTFAAIAEQAPAEVDDLWVMADALQGLVYVQRFGKLVEPLRIERLDEWLPHAAGSWISGPGANLIEASPAARAVPEANRHPRPEGVLRVGLRTPPVTRPELFALEPLYLRGSSAEEKAKREAP